MNTKEKIRDEIDHLPEDALDDVLRYLYSMKNTTMPEKEYNLHLNGQFEDRALREVEASEIPNELTAFQEFLLTAPVMTDEDYNFFLEKKQSFNKWK